MTPEVKKKLEEMARKTCALEEYPNSTWQRQGFMMGAQAAWEMAEKDAKERIFDLEEALRGILSTVALDWYIEQFAKDEKPHGCSTGIAARVHNRELILRIRTAFERARKVLNPPKEGEGE